MIWFLRLFRTYRDLEAELAEAAGARIKAEDDARYWRARADGSEQQRVETQVRHEFSLKQSANFEAVRNGSTVVPYPDTYNSSPSEWIGEKVADRLNRPGPLESRIRRSLREVQQDAVMKSRAAAASRRMALANGDVED